MSIMNHSRLQAWALLLCLLAGANSVRAQAVASPVLLKEDTLAQASDSLVITLRKRGAYRVALEPAVGTLSIRHLRLPGSVIIHPVKDSVGYLSYYAVQLPDDGAYAVRVTGRDGAVVVRVFGDVAEETRMTTERVENRKRSWSFGFLGALGRHSGYATTESVGKTDGGADWEVGLAASNIGRFGGSFTYGQDRRGSARKVSWISAEARGRLGRWYGIGGRTLDGGLLLRAGIGEVDRVSNDVKMVAPGAYLTHSVLEDVAGRGLQIDLAYQLRFLADGGVEGESKSVHRVSVGVRWLP